MSFIEFNMPVKFTGNRIFHSYIYIIVPEKLYIILVKLKRNEQCRVTTFGKICRC